MGEVTFLWDQLLLAMEEKQNNRVEFILSKINNINASDNLGITPLHMASGFNSADTVSKIVTRPGINVNLQSESGYTPLHEACLENHHQVVRQLLACPGIQVNLRDKDGFTPIMISSLFCHKETLKIMLEDHHVNLDMEDVNGRGLEELVRIDCDDKGRMEDCLFMILYEKIKRHLNQF